MQPNLEDQAIKAALEGRWADAVSLNRSILNESPSHIPTLNRLAKALSQLGQNDEAIATYEQVLLIDKFNVIARKNHSALKANPCLSSKISKTIDTDFLEIPGKTLTSKLVRLGDAALLRTLEPGQIVNLVVKNHWVAVTTQTDLRYIGTLADNISFKLKQLMAAGNTYQAVIRNNAQNQICVFLKETFKSPTNSTTL